MSGTPIRRRAASRSTRPTVIAVGDNTVDVYLDKGWMFPGGNAVNVAAMAARTGCPAAYIGCLSHDIYGELIYSALAAEGLDLSHCRRSDGANACALVGHIDGDRVFLGSRPGVRAEFDLNRGDYDFIGDFDIAHTSVNSDIDALVPRLAETGAFLSYDISGKHTDLLRDQLAPYLGAVFVSLDGDLEHCIGILEGWRRAGAGVAVGTRGSKGSVAIADDGILEQPTVPIDVVDTLGAGDGFIAGFLVTYHQTGSVRAALEAGARNAAATCVAMGAFGYGVQFETLPPNLPPRRDGQPLIVGGGQPAELTTTQPSVRGM